MSISAKEVRSTLNDLIETCKDGQQGFQDAAHHVKDSNLRVFFLELSQERSQFAGDLQQEVQRLGGEPETSGSTTGAIRRGWLDFKARITGQDDHAVISEVVRGEESVAKAYEKALQDNLPADLREIVERQFKRVIEAHNRAKSLEVHTTGGAA